MLDTITGEVMKMTLTHEGNNVREFYCKLPRPVRVGIEATGSMQWFVNLMEELGMECLVGHPAEIRAAEPRKQKHDRRDADLILKLLVENRFPTIAAPTRVDGIILLGGSIDPGLSQARGQIALIAAAGRVTETAALARRFPAARVVISGGDPSIVPASLPGAIPGAVPEAMSEAAATRDLLVELGVPVERIELEGRSRNTEENAVFSLAAAQPKPGETWLLVTSAMHMPRAVGCFRRAGWADITPYPVDYRTSTTIGTGLGLLLADDLVLVNFATKEWLGLVAYYALGRTDALFPAPG